jgi:antitoxin StbD
MQTMHKISHLIEYQIEENMDEILTDIVTPISEFKKNPNLSLKRAGGKPFAVLTNNKPSFYVLSPEVYDELLEIAWEMRVKSELITAGEQYDQAIEVELDDLS